MSMRSRGICTETHLLVHADVKHILAMTTILGDTGRSGCDRSTARLRENGIVDNSINEVGGSGSSVGGGDGTLLQAIQAEIGCTEVFGD